MPRVIRWVDLGGGTRQRVVITEVTREDWLARLGACTTRLQRVFMIGEYRKWFVEEFR